MLRVYIATGARTTELAQATVGDFQPSVSQIIMTKHKRSKTLKHPVVRRIALQGEALAIVKNLCTGREPSEHIFRDQKGRPWKRRRLCNRFQIIRKHAKVRDEITVYSFRHLWISDALMAGVEIATVAKMAGISVAMVEKIYGHLSGDHMSDSLSKLDEFRKKSGHRRNR